MINLFIDGAAGTTGLEIRQRLAGRRDMALVTLPEHRRKNPAARAEALNDADAVILCLPDEAACEAVVLIRNPRVKVIDASTAHRTDPAWTYGFPELEPDQRERIAAATRISNPGCYPTGFLALVRPLVRAGLLPAEAPLSVNAVSGYSGGGKAMIAAFEQPDDPAAADTAFRLYALGLGHKHVREMQAHGRLAHPPIFCPAVARAYRGMLVETPLHLHALPGQPTLGTVREVLEEAYPRATNPAHPGPVAGCFPDLEAGFDKLSLSGLEPRTEPAGSRQDGAVVSVSSDTPALLDLEHAAGTDRLDLFVLGDAAAGQARLVAALDNLGKGAAGAAVQNLNLMCGLGETAGLRL